MLVQHFLEHSAARYPDKIALVCDGAGLYARAGEQRRHRLTYAELDSEANRMAHALQAHGVQRGDRVGIWLPNSAEAVIAIFATLKAGGVFVVINSSTKEDKLAFILNNCRASALFAPAQQAGLAARVRETVPSLQFAVLSPPPAAARQPTGEVQAESEPDVSAQVCDVFGWHDFVGPYPGTCPVCSNIDQDLACLIYTSGSTGDPKGVVSGHNNVVFASGSIMHYVQNTADDIVINVLPLSFDYGLYQLLMVMRFGGTLVLERSFAYPAAVLKRMEAEHVTGLPGVPTLFAMLVRMDLSTYDLSSLRYITNTAAALPPSHILELQAKFPQAVLYSMYGLTECKRALYLPPDQLSVRPGSVGIAIPGTEVWIEGEDGTRAGPGQVGELVVRGSHVMRGYWESPELTAARYCPGPTPGEHILYSGDLFRMDEEGYLYFVARKDDIIKSRGEKVAPKEVENVLYELPGVVEAAVVGIPDPVLGQAIKAFVVLDGAVSLTDKEILRHCRANLEDLMVPQQVEIRDSLPKTSSGKIQKSGLV